MNTNFPSSVRPFAQQGLSLLELLVSMLIGLIILAGVIQVFEGNIRTSRYQDALAIVQENGRFALNVLARDLRQAGYAGCKSSSKIIRNALDMDVASQDRLSNSLRYGIEAWDADGTDGYGAGASFPAGFPFYTGAASVATDSGHWVSNTGNAPDFSFDALPGSDIIRLTGGFGPVSSVLNISSNTVAGADIELESAVGFQAQDFVVRNECRPETPVLMQVCSVAGDTLSMGGGCTLGNDPAMTFVELGDDDPAARLALFSEIVAVDSRVYFVGLGAGNVPALFRSTLGADGNPEAPQELVEGIENIQYLFGLDTHADAGPPAVYVPPSGLPDYAGLAFEDSAMATSAVRIFLMATSAEDNLVQPGEISYRFMGEEFDQVPDGRIRQVFSRTVSVRNNISIE